MKRFVTPFLSYVGGCSTVPPASVLDEVSQATPVVLTGLTVIGPDGAASEPMDLAMADGRISEIVPTGTQGWESTEQVDLNGHWAVPAFIDSHVHLAYLEVASEMADGGVAAAVDLAAPVSFFSTDTDAVDMIRSGPMITPVGGYPTQSWGSDGYGLECADADAVEAGIRTLAGLDAGVVKVPIGQGTELSDAQLERAVATASELGLPIVSHATTEEGAARAAAAGVGALAHTPTVSLSDDTVLAWSGGAVISTLRAFGGSSDTIQNLGRLHQAGSTVLYGTDMGNLQTPGIVEAELLAMQQAGMSPLQIIGSGTWVPAAWWGLGDLGTLESGKQASLLIVATNPLEDVGTLATPTQVWIDGSRRD